MNAPPTVPGRVSALVGCALLVTLGHWGLLSTMDRHASAVGEMGITRVELAVVGELALADPVAMAAVSMPGPTVSVPGAEATAVVVPPASAASASMGGAPDRPSPKRRRGEEPAVPDSGSAGAPPSLPPETSSTDPAAPGVAAAVGTADAPADPGGGNAVGSATDISPETADTPTVAAPAAGGSTGPALADAAAESSSAAAFEWPPSTRLTYVLTGNYQGEVQGSARVEWLRDGDRYQVNLDVVVGLRVAPLLSRRMTSTGALGPQGLMPERYEEVTKMAFRDPRRVAMRFGGGEAQLADGRRVEAPAGLQDTASQFVQMAYRFAIDPSLLAPGGQVALSLALPRRVDPWIYDVVGPETLYTAFGAIEAIHLKPRPIARSGDTLTAEAWFAPRLRYLPVRIRIHQNDETYIDLLVERLPDLLKPAGR